MFFIVTRSKQLALRESVVCGIAQRFLYLVMTVHCFQNLLLELVALIVALVKLAHFVCHLLCVLPHDRGFVRRVSK